jgi:choline kinase|tara:strand:+ start:4455 stop:5183 length:729 start_codon:yes stop_codon:yes gene_type:complete
MKAIVLAAGQGSRMGEATKTLPKPLMEFGRSSIISRLIRQLLSRNVQEINIVVGYMHELIREEVASHFPDTSNITFTYNHAYKDDTNILSAYLGIEHIASEDFAIFESDCIYSDQAMDMIVSSFNNLHSCWYTIGDFIQDQNGGILLSNHNREIQDIKIVPEYLVNYFGYKKLIGLLYVSSDQSNRFKMLLTEALKISSKQYYLQPWIDHLKDLPCVEIPLPKGSSGAFNNKLEYNDALMIQ